MKERLLPLLLLSADAVRYKFASKNSIIPALSTLHSRPTFTAGSSSFAIILRTCWRVVLSRAAELSGSYICCIDFVPVEFCT